MGHAAEHVAADPERQQEHHHQRRNAESQAQARADPLGFRRRSERVGQVGLVERRGAVEELGDPEPFHLELAHLRHDVLAGVMLDEPLGQRHSAGMKALYGLL